MKKIRTESDFAILATLFFETRQIIRRRVPKKGKKDPNEWIRLETLRFIAGSNDPTMREVALHLHVEAPSATSLIATLHRAGLVERKAGTRDKRVTRVHLTPKGNRILQNYLRQSKILMERVFGKLSEKEIRSLTVLLERLIAAHRD
jgi:DNA-binding MarR family transcriptional regulator